MKTILLLEDDENLNRGISLKLSKEGYRVKCKRIGLFMDRESKQKIGYAAVGLLFLFLSISILFLGRMSQERRLREEQRQELETIYPEIREELEENFEFYQKESMGTDTGSG